MISESTRCIAATKGSGSAHSIEHDKKKANREQPTRYPGKCGAYRRVASSMKTVDEGARPLGKKEQRKASRHGQRRGAAGDTLQARCRAVIAANLERYPPESFVILSDDIWDSIVCHRHYATTPSTKTGGGIDGTGRLLPAISDRFLVEVERTNPHLSESKAVDKFVWRDCVEYRFKTGGPTRPAALKYPWPILVETLNHAGDGLVDLLNGECASDIAQELMERHIQTLSEPPMSVSLLQATGVGKSVKTFLKLCSKSEALDVITPRQIRVSHTLKSQPIISPQVQLEELLQGWKDMAAKHGVAVANAVDVQGSDSDDQEDIRLAESCRSWRELFLVLQEREEKRRANQGARIRELRQNLNSVRPKVIKVRPANPRYEKILDRPSINQETKGSRTSTSFSTSAGGGGNAKMRALKKESAVATKLQKSSAKPSPSKKASFGNAVGSFASAASGAGSKKRKAGTTVALAAGKQMKLPSKGTVRLAKYGNQSGNNKRR